MPTVASSFGAATRRCWKQAKQAKSARMQITVEQISPVLVELSVQIDADRVTLEYEKAFGAIQKRSRIKGFRPGKASREIVRRVYGARVDADVIQRLVDESFPQA